MESLLEIVKKQADTIYQQVVGYRRYIHSNPELSFQEVNTSQFIAKTLKENNIECFESISGHGIIGIIKGKTKGKTIGLRAELDALPIQENATLDFRSMNNGVMHACGHDIHMASLLGSAILINRLRDSFKGTILLIFEPGEEKLPGGALGIIESAIFKQNMPELMLAFHVLPELEVGKAGFCRGQYMASGDEVYITVKGKGGHAALPKTTVNPILLASTLILKLKDLIDNESPLNIPTILSFGKIQANGATNVIPSELFIEGTFRTMDELWRQKAHALIKEISTNTCQSLGGDCDVEIRKGYPSIFNDVELTKDAQLLSEQYLGISNVIKLDRRMTTDDFAYFSQKLPSVFFRMGIGFEENCNYQLHNPNFVANEEVLKYSSGLMAWITLNLLDKPK